MSAGFLLIYPDTSRTTCIRLEYGLSQPGIGLDGYAVKPLLSKPRRENASRKGIGEDGYAAMKDYFCVGTSVHYDLGPWIAEADIHDVRPGMEGLAFPKED